jgi:tetratricopeptide (TPR) repeat protein
MTKEKKSEKTVEKLLDIPIFNPENRSKLEHFIHEKKNLLSYALSAILVVVLLFIAYKVFYIRPKEKEAKERIYMAQNYFAKDSFALALNGKDDMVDGFQTIVDEFGGTPTGNLAKYYAGICYLRLGEYEDAIKYLKKFSTNSEMLKPLKFGGIGDAYSQLKEYEEAGKYYLKAAKAKKNSFTAPHFYMKAGLIYEKLEDNKKAKEIYQTVKDQFPKSQEAMNADKFMGRVEARLAASEK